jgi:hypothetical protein
MTYIAKFVTAAKFENVTDKLKPFIIFHSGLEDITVENGDKVIILQIEGTESYFPIFLKTNPTLEEIESKLAKQETRLNTETKKLIKKYLSDK